MERQGRRQERRSTGPAKCTARRGRANTVTIEQDRSGHADYSLSYRIAFVARFHDWSGHAYRKKYIEKKNDSRSVGHIDIFIGLHVTDFQNA